MPRPWRRTSRPDVAHEDKAFEGLDVRAGGDLVHRDGNARVVAVAELSQDVARGFLDFPGLAGSVQVWCRRIGMSSSPCWVRGFAQSI